MKRVSGWMAAASCLLAVPAMASDDVDAKLAEMQHRADLYDLVDYEAYSKFDTSIFDFHVER